jgi:hypothetical protein
VNSPFETSSGRLASHADAEICGATDGRSDKGAIGSYTEWN